MALYNFPEELDIIRYYEGAEQAILEFKSVLDYAEFWFESHIDFIYPSSLYLALKIGMPLNVITIFYMSLYYITIFEIIRKHFPYFKVQGYVFLYVAMFAPFMWIQSISRNLAAIAFFYVAIKSLLNNEKLKSILWLIVSVFTHVSMLMYIPVIPIAMYLRSRNISNKLVIFGVLTTLVFSFYAPSQLLSIISMVLEGGDSRYALAYGDIEAQGALMNANIGYGDKLPIVVCFIFSIVLLLLNKTKDFMYWMLYVLTLMLSFFILSSLMFTNRVIMLMALFVAYNTYKVMNEGDKLSKQIVSFFAFIGSFIVLLHFYAYRPYYSLIL